MAKAKIAGIVENLKEIPKEGDGFISIKKSLPPVKLHSHVAASSEVLILRNEKGGEIKGRFQQFLMDTPHHKKGSSIFHSLDNVTLTKVVAWKLA